MLDTKPERDEFLKISGDEEEKIECDEDIMQGFGIDKDCYILVESETQNFNFKGPLEELLSEETTIGKIFLNDKKSH